MSIPGYDAWKLRSPYDDDDYDSRNEPDHCPICGFHDDDGHTKWCEFRVEPPAKQPSWWQRFRSIWRREKPAPVTFSPVELDDDVPF